MLTSSRSCNLECVKDKREGDVLEFVGPVKIVLVDQPPNIYRRRVWGAAFIVAAQMMMGATTMTLLFYAFTYKTNFLVALHVFVCTVGYQLCMPSAILSLNKQNGSAAPMRVGDRQYEHVFLQFFGLALAVGSTITLVLGGNLFRNFTLHSFVGMVAGLLAILTVAGGLFLFEYFAKPDVKEMFGKFSRYMSSIHRLLGILTFMMSSFCFILGISKPRFEQWVPVPQMLPILIFFCMFYTVIVLYRPIRKVLTEVF